MKRIFVADIGIASTVFIVFKNGLQTLEQGLIEQGDGEFYVTYIGGTTKREYSPEQLQDCEIYDANFVATIAMHSLLTPHQALKKYLDADPVERESLMAIDRLQKEIEEIKREIEIQ